MSCSGCDICGTTPAFRSDVNIAIAAIRNSFWFNIVKKQRTNAKSERSKCCGLAISRSRQIYAMIGVELRTRGEIFVKSWRRKCSFAYDSYSSKDCESRLVIVFWFGGMIWMRYINRRVGNPVIVVKIKWLRFIVANRRYTNTIIHCHIYSASQGVRMHWFTGNMLHQIATCERSVTSQRVRYAWSSHTWHADRRGQIYSNVGVISYCISSEW